MGVQKWMHKGLLSPIIVNIFNIWEFLAVGRLLLLLDPWNFVLKGEAFQFSPVQGNVQAQVLYEYVRSVGF